MEERHHRRPTLISTNLPFAAWQDFLGNPALTKALLSRVRERCHTFIIDGPCLRPQTGCAAPTDRPPHQLPSSAGPPSDPATVPAPEIRSDSVTNVAPNPVTRMASFC